MNEEKNRLPSLNVTEMVERVRWYASTERCDNCLYKSEGLEDVNGMKLCAGCVA